MAMPSVTASTCMGSCRCPAVISTATGRPLSPVTRWNLLPLSATRAAQCVACVPVAGNGASGPMEQDHVTRNGSLPAQLPRIRCVHTVDRVMKPPSLRTRCRSDQLETWPTVFLPARLGCCRQLSALPPSCASGPSVVQMSAKSRGRLSQAGQRTILDAINQSSAVLIGQFPLRRDSRGAVSGSCFKVRRYRRACACTATLNSFRLPPLSRPVGRAEVCCSGNTPVSGCRHGGSFHRLPAVSPYRCAGGLSTGPKNREYYRHGGQAGRAQWEFP